jgi:hypothetical protein
MLSMAARSDECLVTLADHDVVEKRASPAVQGTF